MRAKEIVTELEKFLVAAGKLKNPPAKTKKIIQEARKAKTSLETAISFNEKADSLLKEVQSLSFEK